MSVGQPLTLLKGATNVYSPGVLGKNDILIGGTKVVKISSDIVIYPIIEKVVDLSGMIVIPGFVDLHVHATGGGGELGPMSRTPEARFEEVVNSGTTTIVGILGTDGVSRSLNNLLVKLNGFEQLGLTTYMWTGSYQVPPPTITGSLLTDVILVNKIIGAGEIAISDHRSSAPTHAELSRIVADCRVAGLLSSKGGTTYFHVGSGKGKLTPLFDIVEKTDIPITQMIPTHMSGRGPALLEDGIRWLRMGGRIDLTADSGNETDTAQALIRLKQENLLPNVSISSDAYGSMPVFDNQGNLITYDYQKPWVLYEMFRKMVLNYKWKIEEILPLVTKNPASFIKVPKGEILVNGDADLVVLDELTLKIQYVYSKGELIKTPTWTKPAMFACV
jgi:beta-aspartyl-dipeptidase (metallo-type)